MGGECSTHGRNERYTQSLSANLNGKDLSADLGLDKKIILEWRLGK
jgi:hypothetical protein